MNSSFLFLSFSTLKLNAFSLCLFHRYDARLLLSSLPRQEVAVDIPSSPPSPSGWSDHPSDSEDTFFFSTSEISDYQRNKRRRLLDAAQSSRLQSLRLREGLESGADEDSSAPEEVWGDDDEQPEEEQAEFMRRTARHIVSSPDAVLLEMRILANHGSDRRFAFLRGRWKHAWQGMKVAAKANTLNGAEQSKPLGLALGNYGDSDEDSDPEQDGTDAQTSVILHSDTPGSPKSEEVDLLLEEAAKEARRVRAREWAAKRRAEKAAKEDSEPQT